MDESNDDFAVWESNIEKILNYCFKPSPKRGIFRQGKILGYVEIRFHCISVQTNFKQGFMISCVCVCVVFIVATSPLETKQDLSVQGCNKQSISSRGVTTVEIYHQAVFFHEFVIPNSVTFNIQRKSLIPNQEV